jgi:hypothetical protein
MRQSGVWDRRQVSAVGLGVSVLAPWGCGADWCLLLCQYGFNLSDGAVCPAVASVADAEHVKRSGVVWMVGLQSLNLSASLAGLWRVLLAGKASASHSLIDVHYIVGRLVGLWATDSLLSVPSGTATLRAPGWHHISFVRTPIPSTLVTDEQGPRERTYRHYLLPFFGSGLADDRPAASLYIGR